MTPVRRNYDVLRRDLLALAQTVAAGALLVAVVVGALGLVALSAGRGTGHAWAGDPVGLTRPTVPGMDQLEALAPPPSARPAGAEPTRPQESSPARSVVTDPQPVRRTPPADGVVPTPTPPPAPTPTVDPAPDPDDGNAIVELAEDLAGVVTGVLGGLLP